MLRDQYRSRKGSVLVMAVVLSFVTVMLGVTFLTFAFTLHNKVDEQIGLEQTNLTSISYAMLGMFNKITGKQNPSGLTKFYDDNWGWYEIINAGSQPIGYGTSNLDRIIGHGTSTYGEGDYSGDAIGLFTYESYADFLYISHHERDSLRHEIIRFWTPDTLDGKVHSNDTIHISPGSDRPVFKEHVSTTMNYIDPSTNNARFDQGWGFREPIIFPDQATEIRRNSGYIWGTLGNDSLTQIVLSDRLIRMRKCGLRHIGNADSIACYPADLASAPSYTIPITGCVFVYGKVWISACRDRVDMMDGEVPERSKVDGGFTSNGFEGKLTIGSSDTMIITDNLVYKHSRSAPPSQIYSVPTTLDSCGDVLGLVSERYIMIGRLVRDTVYINAAMAAVSGSISVQDIYMNHAPGWNNEKQSLVIYGSLAQRNRGIVHTTDYPIGHLRGFIEKDYHYDVRLREFPPPHYLPARGMNFVLLTDDGGN
jgi:hypothetical protein